MNRKAYYTAYYHHNRVKAATYGAKYRRQNRIKIATRMAIYHRKNREKIATYHAEYYRRIETRYKRLMRRHNMYLVPRGIKGFPLSFEAYYHKLYDVDGRERPCYYCHGKNNKSGVGLDRKDSWTTYTQNNTVPSCRGCNGWKGRNHTYRETMAHFKPMRVWKEKV